MFLVKLNLFNTNKLVELAFNKSDNKIRSYNSWMGLRSYNFTILCIFVPALFAN